MRKIVFHSDVNAGANSAEIALHYKGQKRPLARVERRNGAWHFAGNSVATMGVPLLRIPHTLKGHNGARESVTLGQALLAFRSHVEGKLAELRGK